MPDTLASLRKLREQITTLRRWTIEADKSLEVAVTEYGKKLQQEITRANTAEASLATLQTQHAAFAKNYADIQQKLAATEKSLAAAQAAHAAVKPSPIDAEDEALFAGVKLVAPGTLKA